MSTFLTTAVFDTDTDIYATNYGKVITNYMRPMCPLTPNGGPQVYNTERGACTAISASAAASAAAGAGAASAAECGGDPFKVKLGNSCYTTNDCPVSPPLSAMCLNSQHVAFK